MNKLTYETIKNESKWVAKMQGWREVGTYAEIEHLAKSEDCRDCDILCADSQPEHLKPFFKAYEAQYYNKNITPIFLLEEFYNEWIKTQ